MYSLRLKEPSYDILFNRGLLIFGSPKRRIWDNGLCASSLFWEVNLRMWSGETKEDETRKGKPIQGCSRELVTTVGKWNQSPRGRFRGTMRKGREEFYPLASISTGQSFFWGVLTPLHVQFCACVHENGWAGSPGEKPWAESKYSRGKRLSRYSWAQVLPQ